MEFKLTMSLKSDTIPGKAESYGTFIDKDIATDRFGLPYIPARRIKGILRKNAKYIHEELLNYSPVEIFGKRGMKKEYFRISNGYLNNYWEIREFLEKIKNDIPNGDFLGNIFAKDRILEEYTTIRSLTKIDYEKGVAEKHSLRTIRCLKKGLIFNFQVSISNKDISEGNGLLEDLTKICKISRHFGSNRNRGFGNINLNIEKDSENADDMNVLSGEPSNLINDLKELNDEDGIAIELELHNREHLIITPYVGYKNKTVSFIPGSMILGAIASKFIKINKLRNDAHLNEDFKNIFLKENVIFSNFYPIKKEDDNIYPSLPIPKSIYKLKYGDKIYNLIAEGSPPETIKGLGGLYGPTDREMELSSIVEINTSINYHFQSSHDLSKGAASKGGQNFFQYESIEPGYIFKGEIRGKYRYLRKIIVFFKNETSELRISLGKSRSAEYGGCDIKLEKIREVTLTDFEKETLVQKFIVYLVSDMILLNKNGHPEPSSKILINLIEKEMDIVESKLELSDERQYLDIVEIGGYSGIWGLPKIQYPALKKGSIFLVKSEDKIDLSKLKKKYFGIKTNEGFGQVKILQVSDDFCLEHDLSTGKSEPMGSSYSASIKEFVISLVKKYIINQVKDLAIQTALNYKGKVSPSKIARIKAFLNENKDFSYLRENYPKLSKSGKKTFKSFFKILFIEERENENEKHNKNEDENNKIIFTKFNQEIEVILNKNKIRSKLFSQFREPIEENRIFSYYFQYYKAYYQELFRILELKSKKEDDKNYQ